MLDGIVTSSAAADLVLPSVLMRLEDQAAELVRVYIPRHYANAWDRAADGTGLERLRSMAVISERKVTATQGDGQDHGEVARDAYKLSMLLDELRRSGLPEDELPLAYLCVLDTHPRKTYAQHTLRRHFERLPHDPRVVLLVHSAPPQHRARFSSTPGAR